MENKNIKGFTIVELIVSVAIIAVISAVTFWNGIGFNDKVALNSVAQDVSLAIRSAQNYSSSVRESSTGSSNFNLGYGIVFDNANPSQAIIYVDTNGNNQYDGTSACTNECIQKILLRNGITIQTASGGISAKNSAGTTANGTAINFTFIRPSLSATITLLNSGSVVSGSWVSGNIVLKARGSATRTVSINVSGQISVQ